MAKCVHVLENSCNPVKLWLPLHMGIRASSWPELALWDRLKGIWGMMARNIRSFLMSYYYILETSYGLLIILSRFLGIRSCSNNTRSFPVSVPSFPVSANSMGSYGKPLRAWKPLRSSLPSNLPGIAYLKLAFVGVEIWTTLVLLTCGGKYRDAPKLGESHVLASLNSSKPSFTESA